MRHAGPAVDVHVPGQAVSRRTRLFLSAAAGFNIAGACMGLVFGLGRGEAAFVVVGVLQALAAYCCIKALRAK